MPPDGPTAWTTTLREHGRLVVPPRRDRLVLTLVVSGGILVVNGSRTVGRITAGDPWDFFAYVRAVLAIVAAIALLMILNKLRTRRWTLVVDTTGVTLGSQRLAWPEIAQVTAAKDQVILHPTPGATELRITSSTVRDPTAFARWLTTQLKTAR